MVVYENEMAYPRVRSWTKTKWLKLAYEGAQPCLYFLDKYATVMVGGAHSRAKSYKNYDGNTLLDRLTPSNIAYSVLFYKSEHDIWKEEILKCGTCHTSKKRRRFNTRPL